jgi:hypothetical protein
MLGFLSGLFRQTVKARVRAPKGRIEKINAWKAGKKARGKWVPHEEYVKRKRNRR